MVTSPLPKEEGTDGSRKNESQVVQSNTSRRWRGAGLFGLFSFFRLSCSGNEINQINQINPTNQMNCL
jgi:hypothetical protein